MRTSAPAGHESVDPKFLAPIFGADMSRRRGYHSESDVTARVTETADGVDVNEIWNEQVSALSILNEHRTTLASLLSYTTTDAALAVAQGPDAGVKMELASEFGVPSAYRPNQDYLRMGLPFKDWDTRSAFTWKFLRDASSEQVSAIFAAGIEADNRLVTGSIFNRLFRPAEGIADDTMLRSSVCKTARTASPRPPTWGASSRRPPRTTSPPAARCLTALTSRTA